MRIPLFLTVCLASGYAAAESLQTYHIGNSLTQDANPHNAVAAIAAEAGHTLTAGTHIRCANPLHLIVQEPAEICITDGPFGTWDSALPNHRFDAITFQPHPTGAATLQLDVQSISTLVDAALQNPANSDTQVYIYSTFPEQPLAGETLAGLWQTDTSGDDGGTRTRDHMLEVLAGVRAGDTAPEQNALLIPVGDVLAALDVKARNGELFGITSGADFYRDPIHLNNIGRYAASVTFYSVMFGESAEGTSLPAINYFESTASPNIELTEDIQLAIQQTAWDVVSNDPNTGVPEPGTGVLVVGGVLLVVSRRFGRNRPDSCHSS
jgi:hypothetical protein